MTERPCFVCDGTGIMPRARDVVETRKCPCCDGTAKTTRLAARDLYGSHIGHMAIILGCGPSLKKALAVLRDYRNSMPRGVFLIALNRSIRKIAADYWLWLDGSAYLSDREHPHARHARRLGPDYYASLYDPGVYIYERALKIPGDLIKLKVLHRGTSLIAAISIACLFGAARIVVAGCDHKITPEEAALRIPALARAGVKTTDPYGIYQFTFARIDRAISEMPLWKPDWVSVLDASGGNLPLPKTDLRTELESWKGPMAIVNTGGYVHGNVVRSTG